MKLTPYAQDCIARYPMTVDQALKLVKPDWSNDNMIQALQLCSWHNSIQDEMRLVAAIIVKRHRARIYYDGPKNGYRTR